MASAGCASIDPAPAVIETIRQRGASDSNDENYETAIDNNHDAFLVASTGIIGNMRERRARGNRHAGRFASSNSSVVPLETSLGYVSSSSVGSLIAMRLRQRQRASRDNFSSSYTAVSSITHDSMPQLENVEHQSESGEEQESEREEVSEMTKPQVTLPRSNAAADETHALNLSDSDVLHVSDAVIPPRWGAGLDGARALRSFSDDVLEASDLGLGRRPSVGTTVKVRSMSAGRIFDAIVTDSSDDMIKVGYVFGGRCCLKSLPLPARQEQGDQDRCAKTVVQEDSFRQYQVLIRSASAGRYVEGVITDESNGRVRVQYFLDGRACVKTVPALSGDLQRPRELPSVELH